MREKNSRRRAATGAETAWWQPSTAVCDKPPAAEGAAAYAAYTGSNRAWAC